jgi:hypothetical protein
MLSIVILCVTTLNVVELRATMLSVITLNAKMLCALMLSTVIPKQRMFCNKDKLIKCNSEKVEMDVFKKHKWCNWEDCWLI